MILLIVYNPNDSYCNNIRCYGESSKLNYTMLNAEPNAGEISISSLLYRLVCARENLLLPFSFPSHVMFYIYISPYIEH